MITLGQTLVVAFTNGLLFGLYFITVCSANRWLLFEDEGWKVKKRIHWLMVTMTNSIATLILAFTVLSVRMPMTQMAFVAAGNEPEDWIDPPWDSTVKVSSCNSV